MINISNPNFMPNTKLLSVPGSSPTSENSHQFLYSERRTNSAVYLVLAILSAILFIGCGSSDSDGSSGNNTPSNNCTFASESNYDENNLSSDGQPHTTCSTSLIAVQFDLTQDATVDSVSFQVKGAQNATAPTKFKAIIYADNNGNPGNVLDDTQPEVSVPVKTNTTETVTFNKFLNAQKIWVAMKWVVAPPTNDDGNAQHSLRADSTLDYPNLVRWNFGAGWVEQPTGYTGGDMAVKLNITPKPNKVVGTCLDATGNVLKYYDGASSKIQPASSETAASVKQSNYDENNLNRGGQPQTTCPTSLIAVKFDLTQDATVDSASFEVGGAQDITVETKFKAIIYDDNSGNPGTILDDTQPEISVPVKSNSTQTVTFNKFLKAQKIWVAMKWVVAPPPNDDGKTQHFLRADSTLDYPNLVRWNFGAGWVEPTGFPVGDMAVKLNITTKPNKVARTCPDVSGDVLKYYEGALTKAGQPQTSTQTSMIAVKFTLTKDSTVDSASFEVHGAQDVTVDTKFKAIIYDDNNGNPGTILDDTPSEVSVPVKISSTQTVTFNKFLKAQDIWVAMKWVVAPPPNDSGKTQHNLFYDSKLDCPSRYRWNFGAGWVDPTSFPVGDSAIKLNITQ